MDENPPSKRFKVDSRKTKNRVEERSSIIHQQTQSVICKENGFTLQVVGESDSVKSVVDHVGANATPNTSTITTRSPLSLPNRSTEIKRPQQIFSHKQEEELSGFVRDASDYYNGLTSKDVRVLAYVYGVCNQVDLPTGWRDKHEATFAWCSRFTKRYKLSLQIAGNSG